MTPERVPLGWRAITYGDVLIEQDERAGDRLDLPVLSVTKSRGPMLASERFGKILHSRDLSNYRVAHRDAIVADPMLLWDGSIGIQRAVDAGLVSPDYRVYAAGRDADPGFMAYVVRSPTMLSRYQGGARGTNVRRNRIARADFQGIPVALPPLPEQLKITAILATIDDVVKGTQVVIDQIQVVKKAMMTEFLACGLPGRHSRFKQTEIGEIPAAWEVRPVRDLVEFCDYGISAALSSEASGVAVLRMGNMKNGRVILDDLKYVSPEVVRQDLFLATGDVLFNRTNSKELVGKVGLFLGAERPVTFASYLLRLRSNKERANGCWLSAVLNTDNNQEQLRSLATPGVGQVNINRTKMLSLEVAVPPLGEQAEVVTVLDAIDNRLLVERAGLSAIVNLKDALMSVLLTGELRVTPDGATP